MSFCQPRRSQVLGDSIAFFASLALLCTASLCFIPARKSAAQTPEEHKYTNALIDSTSPYLLQHAHNPVNWMPWGPEAFAKAKKENKPIFVSIGYSTCFWCHVMERESFENEQVAKILNDHYIAIKVDREQRPDIDEQLMIATQLLTGRGGWPNSVWLTTDGRPWMAGTYFPRAQFMEALQKLSDVWKQQPEAVDKQANAFAEAIRATSSTDRNGQTIVASGNTTPLEAAIGEAGQLYDEQHGGFGSRPKFPPHGMLRLLAFEAQNNQNDQALAMLKRTLDGIWSGGIHDHVGGGFHRYSTDERWFLPHFEKMLYDNAQLMRAYSDAYEITRDELYRKAVDDIFQWLSREMTHEQGGFYSAIDSESDDEEGRYYTWSLAELAAVLGQTGAESFAATYNFEEAGNFAEEATGKRPGTNIPHLRLMPEQIRRTMQDPNLEKQRRSLQAARKNREYPHLDDKVIASWNGLMISSLAHAGRVFDEPRYTQAASRAADFALKELMQEEVLWRTWRDGKAEFPGYLEDYAFLAEGFSELYQTTQDARWLEAAQALTDSMLEQFEDQQHGGFFFTGPKHEDLIVRSKNLNGGGNLPVANGVAAIVLLELYKNTNDAKYRTALENTLSGLAGLMLKSPRQVEHLVLADAQFRQLQSQSKSDTPDASYVGEAVQAELFVSHASVRPGQEIRVALVVNVDPRFHLYAETDEPSDIVRPTTVKLIPTQGLVVGEPQLPAGVQEMDDVLKQEITKLKGRNLFVLPAKIRSEPDASTIPISVELEYQACDQTRCLRPIKVLLEFQIDVGSEAGPPRHPSVIP